MVLPLRPRPEHHPQQQTPLWPERFRQLAGAVEDSRLRAFYQGGVVSADTPLGEVPFVALDLETTGLNPRKHDIVSVGLVPFDLQRIRCRDARHWILKPRRPLAKESVVIHGITHSEVRQAPDLLGVLEPLLESLAGRIVVVHYRHIERGFLDAVLKRRMGEGIEFPVVDTMELEARLHRVRPLGIWARLMGKKPVSIRLADSRTRYGLPYYQAHHALTDALATAELLQAQIAHRFSPDTPIEALWL
ncbi:3'-5' exonuclease [Marinobacterium arenosum]|uniref:3'-5' exonuclease n=1 Tax=Marinobacterium arenosum TaxID=2862496 RepID=UPI001C97123E|nr:3'-5' exonuclease [Marinobacterium arenosum]MBY4678241.1 3'-5' exonuclease [Marinobacterium arenosum]